MMRRILVDRARARKMAKRSGRWTRVTLVDDLAQQQAREVNLLDLDRALIELASFDARKRQLPELRFLEDCHWKKRGICWDFRWPPSNANGKRRARGFMGG